MAKKIEAENVKDTTKTEEVKNDKKESVKSQKQPIKKTTKKKALNESKEAKEKTDSKKTKEIAKKGEKKSQVNKTKKKATTKSTKISAKMTSQKEEQNKETVKNRESNEKNTSQKKVSKKATKKLEKEKNSEIVNQENKEEFIEAEEVAIVSKKEVAIEEIKKTIKNKKVVPKEEIEKINKKLFTNIIVAICIIIYFIFLNLGHINIKPDIYVTDLKVFSMCTLLIAIALIEIAYKKDSGEIALYGIEIIVLSLCTVALIYVNLMLSTRYVYIVSAISYIFAIYYLIKSIVIYLKKKKQYFVNDMKEIMNKDE